MSIASTGSALSDCRIERSSGVFSTGLSVCCRPASAINMSPRPIAARPTFFSRLPCDQRNTSTPTSTSGAATRPTLNDSTCVMSAVPTFAPSMTESAGGNAITPAAVNDIAISPVAVLLCRSVVIPRPVRNACQRCPRFSSRAWRSVLPHPRCTPVLTMWVPHKSNPTWPASSMRTTVPDINFPFACARLVRESGRSCRDYHLHNVVL